MGVECADYSWLDFRLKCNTPDTESLVSAHQSIPPTELHAIKITIQLMRVESK